MTFLKFGFGIKIEVMPHVSAEPLCVSVEPPRDSVVAPYKLRVGLPEISCIAFSSNGERSRLNSEYVLSL